MLMQQHAAAVGAAAQLADQAADAAGKAAVLNGQ
jgi:hypothetical protein